MSSSDLAISASDLGKRYRLGELERYGVFRDAVVGALTAPARIFRGRRREDRAAASVWALRNVSFEVSRGEVVGIIGRNGAGKSTLLKILSRITLPTEGEADIYGRVGSLLEVGTGFHPELTGRENTYLNGAILGMPKEEIERKFDDIVSFAGVERFIDTPVKRYSSGMQVRLAFAVAAHLEPDVLLVDEVLAVGDIEFQKRCLGRMEEVSSEGRTVMFISHSMPAVLRLCPRVILLDSGGVVSDGPARDVIRTYLQTGLGTSAERRWPDPQNAPGDEIVRLRSVRVMNGDEEVTEEIATDKPVDIDVEYWLTGPPPRDEVPGVILEFWNEDEVMLFASTNLNSERPNPPPAGTVVRSRCRIPGHLLAEGEVFVKLMVLSRPGVFHAGEVDVVAFHVTDRDTDATVRGGLGGEWPGVVRPRLEWSTTLGYDAGEEALRGPSF